MANFNQFSNRGGRSNQRANESKAKLVSALPSAAVGRRFAKYGNQRVGEHASKKEHYRAQQLKLWQRAGVISDLREQVPFTLIPAQYRDIGTDLKGKPVKVLIERGVRYIADFVYTDNETGQTVVEDTKGVRTKEYIIKRKLMLAVHGIRIREI